MANYNFPVTFRIVFIMGKLLVLVGAVWSFACSIIYSQETYTRTKGTVLMEIWGTFKHIDKFEVLNKSTVTLQVEYLNHKIIYF